jgi:integrase
LCSQATSTVMASIRFRTYGKGKQNASVFIRFSNGKNCNIEIKSGIIIPNSDFLSEGKTRRVAVFKNQKDIQAKLNDLESRVSESLTLTKEYTKVWLQSIVDEFNGKPKIESVPTLIELIDKYCDHIVNSVNVTRQNSTSRTYQVSKMRLLNFQKYTGVEYRINEIGIEFKNDFISWARNIEKYKPSTFLKSVRQIKTVCRYAERLKLPVDRSILTDTDSTQAKKTSQREKPVFLTPDEIEKLMKFDGTNYLNNTRDWFVISCWTGCRVSDLMSLSMNNIHHTINGEKAIRYTQKKTGTTVNAPFHPHVEEILKRNSGFPHAISDQKYNSYIKELCMLVGINELIEGSKMDSISKRKESGRFPKYELLSTHTGRRSFASNHYGKFPIEMLMLVTGHKSIPQFLEYVGENPDEHVSTLNQYYRETASTNNLKISNNG